MEMFIKIFIKVIFSNQEIKT